MPAPQSRYRQPRQLDAGGFQPEISSFRLCLAAEGKAAKTVRTYTEAVAWFAAAHLRRETGLTSWEQVGKQDIQRWIVWLLDRYSSTAGARLRGPRVRGAPRRRPDRRVPATGIRLSELAGIRYDADDPGHSDVDLWQQELTVQGKGRKTRTVKISFDAARSLGRYLRVRARPRA